MWFVNYVGDCFFLEHAEILLGGLFSEGIAKQMMYRSIKKIKYTQKIIKILKSSWMVYAQSVYLFSTFARKSYFKNMGNILPQSFVGTQTRNRLLVVNIVYKLSV